MAHRLTVYELGGYRPPRAASRAAPLSSVATPWGGTVDATLAGRGGPHGGALPLAAAGCSSTGPAGVDGDLVDDWQPLAEATGRSCPRSASATPTRRRVRLPRQLPAGRLRRVAHDPRRRTSATFSGAAAERRRAGGDRHAAVPDGLRASATSEATGVPRRRLAHRPVDGHARCSPRPRRGRAARSGTAATSPRCSRWTTPASPPRSGSLKGALTEASPLTHTCFNPQLAGDDVERDGPGRLRQAAPQRVRRASTPRPRTPTRRSGATTAVRTRAACSVVASYAKLPNDGNLQYRAGTIYYFPHEDEWNSGQPGVKCFLWRSDRSLAPRR